MDFISLSATLHPWALLAVILVMVVMFITERIPLDVTAMAVVVVLMLGGFITAEEAFSGFSSPVVVIMVSTLFVAAALRITGVSDAIARFIQRYAGTNERLAIGIVMLVSAVLSSCMNNVSAAALLMPAVAVLSHEANIAPSRLFIPLAFGVTLGGMLTIIGTPPNILATELVRNRNLEPFSFFEFFPYALAAIAAGTLFMVMFGYKLLPVRKTHGVTRRITDLRALYQLHDRIFSVRVPEDSPVDGKTLGELRFGSFVGGVVVTIIRGGRKLLSPTAEEKLHERDVLLVRGNPERFSQVQGLQGLQVEDPAPEVIASIEKNFQIVSCFIREVHTETRVVLLRELLRTTGIVPLSIERASQERAWESRPPSWFLDSMVHKGDTLIGCIAGRYTEDSPLVDLDVKELDSAASVLRANLFTITIAPGGWSGAPLHRLAHDTKLSVLGLITPEHTIEWFDVPVMTAAGDTLSSRLTADHVLREGERYLVSGVPSEAHRKLTLSSLSFEAEAASSDIDSLDVGIVELVLTPRSELIGKTLADLHFREKYGCQVLALWRDGKPMLSLSSGLPLLYGDALLVQGARKSLPVLAKDPDFLLLSEHRETPRLSKRSAFAVISLLMLMFTPLLAGVPAHEAAFLSAALVVFTGAISMEQAYREIDWRVVFLLALMIPLGHAVEHASGAEALLPLVQGAATSVSPIIVAALFLFVGSMISQVVDNAVAVIFLGPLALEMGGYIPGAPTAFLIAVTLGSSMSFMLPTGCRANMLVTGAGGYKAGDFMRVGTPFTIVVGLALLAAIFCKDLWTLQ
jgi:di/tricarboxylate transporter